MTINGALKVDHSAEKDSMNSRDEYTRIRFKGILEQRQYSLKQAGSMLDVSQSVVSQYLKGTYPGNNKALEVKIRAFCDREEQEDAVPYKKLEFVLTSISRMFWAAFQTAHVRQEIVIVTSSAGSGKTKTAEQYQQKNPQTVIISCDITFKSIGATLDGIAIQLPGCDRQGRNSARLQRIYEHLRGSKRLLIFDEAHFLSWEAVEAIRKIHDSAHVGVVFCGQSSLINQMKGGRRSFAWDQIHSRIGLRCQPKSISKDDAALLSETFCPGLSSECLKFLYGEASGSRGSFRRMIKLLERAMEISRAEKAPITPQLLESVKGVLGLE